MTTERPKDILLCTCEDTMPIDADMVRRGCRSASVQTAKQLCRAELERFRSALADKAPLIVGCTQEAALFRETAGEHNAKEFACVNIRETAGWSDQAADAGPKMAALIAAAIEPNPEVPLVHLESAGVALIYGCDEQVIEAAALLKDHLDVTALLSRPANMMPPRVAEFPVAKGTIRAALGHLGNFDVVVDDFALSRPSSRGSLAFVAPRDGAKSRCDVLLDISGGPALFAAPDLRDGYVRADPGDRAAVLRAVLKVRDLVGTFDKPRYIAFTADLCAHSRSSIVGCRRCLDLCPTGAITPSGDRVTIDEAICAGCGECAAACPTGAAAYALPPSDALMRKLRTLLTVYREAGGANPVLVFHDSEHGGAMIDALSRYGPGLAANVLPLAVNEITQIGPEVIVAAFAYGASDVRLVARGKPRHDIAGLRKTIALAESILGSLGYGSLAVIETDDPDTLSDALRAIETHAPTQQPSSFLPVGQKSELLRSALRALHASAPTPADVVALPTGAPLGTVEIDAQGCTLCLACVTACPTGALNDSPQEPVLRFTEDACVQCGLCAATCPEKVITLVPRIDFGAANAPARVLKREEPFTCIKCGKPFGVKSTIERISAKLAGQHWMYPGGSKRLDLIKMCDTCRVAAVTEDEFDPHGAPPRPHVRTTDDYLRERSQNNERK